MLTAPADLQPVDPEQKRPLSSRAKLNNPAYLSQETMHGAECSPRVLDTPGKKAPTGLPGRRAAVARLRRTPDDLWRHLTASEHRGQRLLIADCLDQAHDAGERPKGRGASLAVRAQRLRQCGELGIFSVCINDGAQAQWVPYRCDDRLCWSCCGHRMRGIKERMEAALELEQPADERLLFVTLTAGRRGTLTPAEALKRFGRGWRNLTREQTPVGDWWRSLVSAALNVFENELSDLGHHPHLHCLISSKGPVWYSVGAWRVAQGKRAEDESAGRPQGLTLREAWSEAIGLAPEARKARRRALRALGRLATAETALQLAHDRQATGQDRAQNAASARERASGARSAARAADRVALLTDRVAQRDAEAQQLDAEAAQLEKDCNELQVHVEQVNGDRARRECLKYCLKGHSKAALARNWRMVGELAADTAGRRLIRTWGRWHGLDADPEPRGDAPELALLSGKELLALARRDTETGAWARLALATLSISYREGWKRRKERKARRVRRREARTRKRAGPG